MIPSPILVPLSLIEAKYWSTSDIGPAPPRIPPLGILGLLNTGIGVGFGSCTTSLNPLFLFLGVVGGVGAVLIFFGIILDGLLFLIVFVGGV